MSQGSIFQILIGNAESEGRASEPTARMISYTDSFRRTYAGAQYRLYQDADLRAFIQDRMGARILNAYDRLRPYAFKADLARYCLLYELGGVYSDLSHLHHHPIWVEGAAMTVFRDLPQHPPWAISNGLIAAHAGRAEFKHAIDTIVDHAETEFYGQSTLDVTGPYLFGRSLAQSSDWQSIHFGRSRWARKFMPFVTREVRVRKFLSNGTRVADKIKKLNGRIDEFITGQGNNYNELWAAKQVWKQDSGHRLEEPG